MSENASAANMPQTRSVWPTVLLVVALLAGLPVAAWHDLTALSEDTLGRQAWEVKIGRAHV